MNCPQCGETVAVIDSRSKKTEHKTSMVYRRRACENCGKRFSTYEMTEDMLRNLLSHSAQLELLRDAITGKNNFAQREKIVALPKMIEHYSK
jgi:transcriptional regulator NrdR family protein